MKNYLSLCIWGDGPGRPYDNLYVLKEITFLDNHTLYLKFQEDEECIICDPQNMILSEKAFTIQSASKIVWTFYEYGKPKSKNTLTSVEYNKLNEFNVHVLEKGVFNRSEIITIKKSIAIDAYGSLDKEFVSIIG